MKKITRILCAVMLLLCVLIPTACTANEDAGTLKIKYLAKGFGKTWMENVSAKFTAQTGVKVKLIPDPSFETSFSKRIQSSSPEDLMYVYTYEWAALAKDYIEDITDFAATTKPDGNKTIEELINKDNASFGKIDDKRYLIPVTSSPTGIIYNATLFESNGWKVPNTTYEMQELVEKIAKTSVKPFAYSTAVSSYWDYTTVPLWGQYSGRQEMNDFINFKNKGASYGSDGKAHGLGFFEQFIVNSPKVSGMPSNYMVGSSNKKVQELVISGQAAMFPDGAWAEKESEKYIEGKNVTLKMMPMPLLCARDSSGRYTEEIIAKKVDGEYERFTYMSAEDYFVIPKKATNKDLAKQFIAFALKEESLKGIHKDTGVPLPYEYDQSKITGLTEFQQTLLDIKASSTGFYIKNTQNPMVLFNKVALHTKYNDIYSKLSTIKATDMVLEEKAYAEANWDKWLGELSK